MDPTTPEAPASEFASTTDQASMQENRKQQTTKANKRQKKQDTAKATTKEEEAEEGRMTMEEVEATFASFASAEGTPDCPAVHTRKFMNLTRDQRARVHDLADAAGFVHFSYGNRSRRVLVIVRNPRPVYPAVYDRGSAQWRPVMLGHKDSPVTPVQQLKVVSYNVLMDANPDVGKYPIDDLLHTEQRWPELLKLLEAEQADLVALQEVTPTFFARLKQEAWVQSGYHISDCSGNSVEPMGNLLLSRFPFLSVEERMYKQEHGMPKSVLLSSVALGNIRLAVAVVHLKAGTGFAPTRASQIEQTIDMQQAQEADAHLLLGDFNMRDIERESNERLDATYVDLWTAVHGPIEPGVSDGFTFDLARNPTARAISERVSAIKKTTPCSSRFDRIYLRSSMPITGLVRRQQSEEKVEPPSAWVVEDLHMVGTEPIATENPVPLFPSDHFGLVATLRVVQQ